LEEELGGLGKNKKEVEDTEEVLRRRKAIALFCSAN
jgi:hypothetical protein